MGNTADLTVAQMMIIDTLHKEGTPQKAGCSQINFIKAFKLNVNWKRVAGKVSQATGMTAALRGSPRKVS